MIRLTPGEAPAGITAAYGAVWVASHRGTTLYRIDPSTDKITAYIDVGQPSCAPLVATGGLIWARHCSLDGGYVAVSSTDNSVVGQLDAWGIIGTDDSRVWACAAGGLQILEIDPRTLAELSRFDQPCELQGFVDGGHLLLNDVDHDLKYAGSVRQIDLQTGQVTATFTTEPSQPETFMAYSDGLIWSHSRLDDFLVHLDTADGRTSKVQVPAFRSLPEFGDQPPVIGLGSVWVRGNPEFVTRLDERTGEVLGTSPSDAAGGGGHIAVGFDSLWQANFATDTVWRTKLT